MNCFVILSLISIVWNIIAMDPEMQLCEDLSIDAAVVADDNVGYGFKGDFFWQMSTSSGISPNFIARYISDRWKGLTGPIDAAFTIDESKYRLSTVFIKGNLWFLYRMESLVSKGTTDEWPYIVNAPVLSAYEVYNNTLQRKDFPVYLLYSGDRFSKYLFKDIRRPTHLANGITYRKGRFLYFMYDPKDNKPGTVLSQNIISMAVISDDKGFIIYGNKEYCTAKMDEIPICEKTTDSEVIERYFGCPRNPFRGTTTTTTETIETTATDTINTANHETNTSEPLIIEGTEETHNTVIETTTFQEVVETKTQAAVHEPQEEKNKLVPKAVESKKKEPKESNSKPNVESKSKIGLIIIVILIVFFAVLFFVVICFLCKSKKSSQKNEDKENQNKVLRNSVLDMSDPIEKSNDDTIQSLRSESTISVRSEIGSDSDEPSDKVMKKSKSSRKQLSDKKFSGKARDDKKSTDAEADQMLDTIRSEEDI